MTTIKRLRALFREVLAEAEANPSFAKRISEALGEDDRPSSGERDSVRPQGQRRSNRRTPGILDPFTTYQHGGEPGLREALSGLDLERLKDIVAEHRMDPSTLAMKWRTPERVIDLIVSTVASRDRKGYAFRLPPSTP